MDIFDKYAPEYAAHNYIRSDEIAISKLLAPGKILIAGVGAGRLLPLFSKWDVTAIDKSLAMVEECRKKGFYAEVMDVQRTTFPDNTFDSIFLPFHTISYVDSVKDSLKELRRILKPSGTLVLSAPNRFYARNILQGQFARVRNIPITKGNKDRVRTRLFSYFETLPYFTTTVKGRLGLQDISDPSWKDKLLIRLPFLDKSLYFICT